MKILINYNLISFEFSNSEKDYIESFSKYKNTTCQFMINKIIEYLYPEQLSYILSNKIINGEDNPIFYKSIINKLIKMNRFNLIVVEILCKNRYYELIYENIDSCSLVPHTAYYLLENKIITKENNSDIFLKLTKTIMDYQKEKSYYEYLGMLKSSEIL